MKNALINGDSLDILKKLPNNSFDSMVTDPPAGIAFMGKKWDKDKGGRKLWIAWLESIMTEAFRTLKPGAHILVWAIPRTSHWTATAIENAEFEIRDVVTHIFGSGFPKSHNIGKKIKEFDGWGTALKPASEHWILARKPLSEKTIAANVLEHGTGGINIDVSRIKAGQNDGRFPANLILSHKPGCKQVGTKEGKGYTINRFTDGAKPFGNGAGHPYKVEDQGPETIAVWDCDDDCAVKRLGEENRFFYCAKASKKEKTLNKTIENKHPTVKSLKLMKYLINLVTPPGGVVLDPFMGSGTTGQAALEDDFGFVGVELEADSIEICKNRCSSIKTLIINKKIEEKSVDQVALV
jgi:site-specific DNA-methyltransferase (adenine-specific)